MGHAEANCRDCQESEAWGRQLRRGDCADPAEHLRCCSAFPSCACMGLGAMFLNSSFSCSYNLVIEEVQRELELRQPWKNTA